MIIDFWLEFSRKCPDIANFTCFKARQNKENQQTTKIQSVMQVVSQNQYVKYRSLKETAIKSTLSLKLQHTQGRETAQLKIC